MEAQESYLNVKKLRGINRRSASGVRNRRDIKITITPETFTALSGHVRFGYGSYGSPLIELSIRLLLALIDNGEEIEQVCKDIKEVTNSPYLQNNVRIFKEMMEK